MKTYLTFALLACAVTLSLTAPAEDLVVDLPGIPGPMTSTHYSGYVNATEGRFFHYWLTESQNDPDTDPLILWLNGGPGCSSLLGALTELGPYIIQYNGVDLAENEYSWNKIANVVFLESPACVGYSYDIDGDCVNSDDGTADANYLALQSFFEKFPEYVGRDFYMTGESYAGIYIPTLAVRILDGMDDYPINLKGYAIGNGYMSVAMNTDSLMFYGRYHAFFDDTLWGNMVDSCCGGIESEETCNFAETESDDCIQYMNRAYIILYFTGFNPYNIYAECEYPRDETRNSELYKSERFATDMKLFSPRIEIPHPFENTSCIDGYPELHYMNLPEVREALNIPSFLDEWKDCWGNDASAQYSRTYEHVKPQLQQMTTEIEKGMIFNGDIDSVCNFLGNEWEVKNLSLPVLAETVSWHVDGQLGGFVKEYQNLQFVKVRGAGHMVPEDKPLEALYMIQSFIEDKPLA